MTGELPPEVREGIEAALGERTGTAATVRTVRPAGGGCIHHAAAVETGAGPFFLKWNRGHPGSAFSSEARGLEALRRALDGGELLRVPEVMAVRDASPGTAGWLLLEYLPPGPPGPGYHARLGKGLAALHSAQAGERFGWEEENRIGSLPQPNPWTDRWPDFWRDARLGIQLESAFREGRLTPADRGWSDRLLASVEPALAPVATAPPALVHGDLWSGNVHPGPGGIPVLVDPAVALGHGEVDLAMMELFGGFREETFRSYQERRPSPPGYGEVRRPLYQLYYLLVHLRLFGEGYLKGTRSAAQAALSAMGQGPGKPPRGAGA